MAVKTEKPVEKTEAAFKREFIGKCYELVMKEILKESKDHHRSTNVQVTIKNYNRYITISKYGQKLCISFILILPVLNRTGFLLLCLIPICRDDFRLVWSYGWPCRRSVGRLSGLMLNG